MKKHEENWKTLNSTYLFKKPWLTVREDSVELPNGSVIPSYYILEYPDWINVIAVTTENKFVFIRQYRPGIGGIHYELCAGVCEKEDTSPLVSAKRELLEETGYGGGKWKKYMEISANPGTHTNTTHCYLATGVEKRSEQNLDETECLTVHLLDREQVLKLLEGNKIKQSLMAAPLWKYFYENK
ncbi:NUDIX hydrolase [Breznakiella homolactica]|uniref:GDP-mannose pyrophosphatase n=1 Tax=Breznakiella homolactica TaxID=2798577 RepID=A0A7T7XPM1_9SPIR|nr:NUDIX hydrolase [Breznakiella homolactica]QQO10199.1 NUDIX hydrolase [Breznakiella homolactica]